MMTSALTMFGAHGKDVVSKLDAIRLVWSEAETLAPGAILDGREESIINPDRLTVPKAETTIDFQRVLIASGGRLRFHEEGMYWDAEQREFTPSKNTLTWDGSQGYELNEISTSDFESGFLRAKDDTAVLELLRPIFVTFWPFDARRGRIAQSIAGSDARLVKSNAMHIPVQASVF